MKPNFVRLLMSTFAMALGCTAFAGNSGGGGELIQDSHNPWFVKNTKVVRYCVEVDENLFPKDKLPLDKMIERSIGFWKNEFASAVPGRMYGNAGVASQDFIKQSCDSSVDIRFQFGILHPAQRQLIKDPSRYVSEVVTTSYDQVNLRGKGFVYFSPDSGPLKFKSDRAPEKTWSSPGGRGKLYLVIEHELGHIFGVPHMGKFPNCLMSEDFPEWIVTQSGAGFYDYEYDNSLIDNSVFGFRPQGQRRKILFSEGATDVSHPLFGPFQFFEVPPGTDDLMAEFSESKIDIEAFNGKASGRKVIGSIILDNSMEQDQYVGGLKIYLTKAQVVFAPTANTSAVDWSKLGYFESIEFSLRHIPAKFKSYISGKEHAAFVEYGPDGFRIGGEVDGVIIPNLVSDYF